MITSSKKIQHPETESDLSHKSKGKLVGSDYFVKSLKFLLFDLNVSETFHMIPILLAGEKTRQLSFREYVP